MKRRILSALVSGAFLLAGLAGVPGLAWAGSSSPARSAEPAARAQANPPRRKAPPVPRVEQGASSANPQKGDPPKGAGRKAARLSQQRNLFELGAGVSGSATWPEGSLGFSLQFTYLPLSFLGVGLETTIVPVFKASPERNFYTFVVRLVAQLPYKRIAPYLAFGGGFWVKEVPVGGPDFDPGRFTALLLRTDLGLKVYVTRWLLFHCEARLSVLTAEGEWGYGVDLLGGFAIVFNWRKTRSLTRGARK